MNPKILLIDQGSRSLKALKLELVEAGFILESESDQTKCLKLIRNGHYNIIMIEHTQSGEETYNFIRDIRKYSDIVHIIIYSSNIDNKVEQAIHSYKAGADDFIMKPLEPKILKAKIQSIMNKYDIFNSKNFNNIVNFGDIIVDRDSNTVYLNHKIIDTTRMEYKVLRVLMRSGNKIITKLSILEEVWHHSNINSKSLEVVISSLKQKLGNDYILTIRGKGYMLVSDIDN